MLNKQKKEYLHTLKICYYVLPLRMLYFNELKETISNLMTIETKAYLSCTCRTNNQ